MTYRSLDAELSTEDCCLCGHKSTSNVKLTSYAPATTSKRRRTFCKECLRTTGKSATKDLICHVCREGHASRIIHSEPYPCTNNNPEHAGKVYEWRIHNDCADSL